MKFFYEYRSEQHSETKYVIYLVTNTISKKYYIGQTRRELRYRWRDYKNDLLKPIQVENRKGCNVKLKRSAQKHYKKLKHTDFLEFSIIEVVDVSGLETEKEKQDKLDEREKYHIKEYREIYGKNNVFNIRDGGNPHVYTEEDNKSNSERKKTFYQTEKGKEQIQTMSDSKKGKSYEELYGEEKAKEIKNKIRENKLIEMNRPEVKENLRKQLLGITEKERYGTERAKEIKEKKSKARKGKYLGKESSRFKIYNNIKLQSPSGEIFTKIEGIKEFSEQYGLCSNHLCELLNNKRKSHKGWKLLKGTNENI